MVYCDISKVLINFSVDFIRDKYSLKLKKQMPIDLYRRPLLRKYNENLYTPRFRIWHVNNLFLHMYRCRYSLFISG